MLVGLLAVAFAAEIHITSTTPIQILVDGRPVAMDAEDGSFVAQVPAGVHTVEARSFRGKVRDRAQVELAADQRATFTYDRRSRSLLPGGVVALAPAALAVPGETVTTAVATPAGAGVWISDGANTFQFQVGASPLGTGVVVQDGHDTVYVGAGPVHHHDHTTVVTETVVTETVVHTPAVAEVPAAPMGMDPGAFAALRQQMQDASFSDDKHALLTTAVAHNTLTIDQLGQLLDAYSFDDDKVRAVEIAREAVVDPENAFRLGSHFSFSDDANRAQALFR